MASVNKPSYLRYHLRYHHWMKCILALVLLPIALAFHLPLSRQRLLHHFPLTAAPKGGYGLSARYTKATVDSSVPVSAPAVTTASASVDSTVPEVRKGGYGLSARYNKDSRAAPVSTFSEQDESIVPTLKATLLEDIAKLKRLQEEDGVEGIDFGVKGGELDEDTRAPRKLDFYRISERVGQAADNVFATVDKLAEVNPTDDATIG